MLFSIFYFVTSFYIVKHFSKRNSWGPLFMRRYNWYAPLGNWRKRKKKKSTNEWMTNNDWNLFLLFLFLFLLLQRSKSEFQRNGDSFGPIKATSRPNWKQHLKKKISNQKYILMKNNSSLQQKKINSICYKSNKILFWLNISVT